MSDSGGYRADQAPGLLGEAVVLDDTGPPRRGRAYPAPGRTVGWLLPAVLLVGGLLLWPMLRTAQASFAHRETDRCGLFANYCAVLTGPDARSAIARTLVWALLVPLVVTSLGYLLAAASRRTREGPVVRLILVIPIAVPLVVTGITFRLMYDPDPGRGVATWTAAQLPWLGERDAPLFLGPGWITVALMSAFVWAWIGLAVVVFRAAMDIIPESLRDAVTAHGGGRLDVLWHAQWRPLLLRTSAVVFVLVALGTTRTIDLILIMAPGSVRDEASVLAVKVWETSAGEVSGPAAALGMLWLLAVAAGVPLVGLLIRQSWPAPAGPDPIAPPPRPTRIWSPARLLVGAAAVLWLIPLIVLVAASLHRPVDVAQPGWWRRPLDTESYRVALTESTLGQSLLFSFALALLATVAVLLIALVAAYPLAWLTGPVARTTGWILVSASIAPIPVIAGPVNEVLARFGSTGTAWGLGLVHVALGVPVAILLLRNSFADLPAGRLRPDRLPGEPRWRLVHRVLRPHRATIVAVLVLQFGQVWNDLVVGLLFGGQHPEPVGLLLYGQARQFVTNGGTLAATAVIVSALPVLLVVLARRQIVAGLISGRIR